MGKLLPLRYPQKFQSDTDRRAWRAYAAAALSGIVTDLIWNEDEVGEMSDVVQLAAHLADDMLDQERKRRV